MTHTILALLTLVVSGIVLGVLLIVRRDFGCYTERIERAHCLTRQSNEMTRQWAARAIDEIQANTDENRLIHEKNLIVFAEVARFRHELHDLINHSRSA